MHNLWFKIFQPKCITRSKTIVYVTNIRVVFGSVFVFFHPLAFEKDKVMWKPTNSWTIFLCESYFRRTAVTLGPLNSSHESTLCKSESIFFFLFDAWRRIILLRKWIILVFYYFRRKTAHLTAPPSMRVKVNNLLLWWWWKWKWQWIILSI